MSIQAYQRAAVQAETPRELEFRALGQATAALVRLKEEGRRNIGALAEALHANRTIWTVLASDCATPGNGLPDMLRAQLISLAIWVDRYSSEVLRQGVELDPLIDVNRDVMEGLLARP